MNCWTYRNCDVTSYRVGVDDDGTIIGGDPLVNGMHLSIRYRRDFVVTDAARLLKAARRVFLELNPEATPDDAAAVVTCAADAVFAILERDGLLGDDIDARLRARAADGLDLGGARAQVVINDPDPLRPGPDCFRTEDPFALPAADRDGAGD
jgi:hypothetical protein